MAVIIGRFFRADTWLNYLSRLSISHYFKILSFKGDNFIMTATIRNMKLKTETCIKSLGRIADARTIRKGLKICLERARIMTDVYKNTDGAPMAIRRAKALAAILDNMTLFTRENELIVGCFASSETSLPTYPELYWRWLKKAVDKLPDYAAMLSEMEKEEFNELNKYWELKSIHGREREYIPDSMPWKIGEFVSGSWMWQWEISTPNYEKILSIGLNGIVNEIDCKIKEVSDDISLPSEDRMKKLDQLRAMKIATEAAARWGLRYADMLENHKKNVTDDKRIKELDRMIETCRQVPANPARNLNEALQCFIFITFIVNYIDQPQVGNGIRFDKIFGPFYDKDINTGTLTRNQAKELVEAVWVKMQEGGYVQPPVWVNNGGGGLGFQTITIGGVDADGKDITNELTYVCLEVMGELQTIAPQIAVRLHDDTPSDLFEAVLKCIHTGCAQPGLFNDNVNIPRLTGLGASIGEARDHGINNCMQPVIPGKNIHYRAGHTGALFLPMCLNLALSEGKFMGKSVGAKTLPVSELRSYDDVWEAFCAQVDYAGKVLTHISNIADVLLKEYIPRPFLSAVLDGNIEKASDMRDWEYLGLRHHLVFGCNNAAGGLAAIKKLVFDDKIFTLNEFCAAVENDFKGEHENIRLMIDRKVPKFGNDEDYVDLISRDIMLKVKKVCDYSIDIYGNPHLIDGTTASAPIGMGMLLPATFDGRKFGEPFHDGSISPIQGKDTRGPTATLRSVAKIDPLKTGNFLLNQKFMPVFFTPAKYSLMKSYLKTWSELGIHHIQFNCVDRPLLLDAKEKPKEHESLVVRVAGYSAYFIDLDNRMQDEIIQRTEQRF
jgi:choline trimethylamine-lyase